MSPATETIETAPEKPQAAGPRREADATVTSTTGSAAAASDQAAAALPSRTSSRSAPRADPVPSASTGLSAAPEYALGIQLDPGPRPLEDIDPEYPDVLKLRSGTVVLRLLISETGHVDEVGVVRSDPPGVFEQAAIDAFSTARFSPGVAAGRAVKSQIRIEVEFAPINRGARISGRSY